MENFKLVLILVFVFLSILFYQQSLRSRISLTVKFIALLPVLALIVLVLFQIKSNNEEANTIISPITKFIENTIQIKNSSGLGDIIQKEINETEGIYAIAIKNLKTKESYYYNENQVFYSASLYKLWYMAESFNQIEKGKLSKNQELSKSAKELNKIFGIDEEYAEIKKGNVAYTVEDAIYKMITVSDNYAAHLLGATIGLSNVKNLLQDYNFNSSKIDVSPPRTTAKDMLAFYELLYNGKLINKIASREMLSILKRQTLNNRIPKYLPKGTVVAHKTGELEKVKHDAGIVYSKNGDYIIVLLSETSDQTVAAEIEAKISKKTWDYFNK